MNDFGHALLGDFGLTATSDLTAGTTSMNKAGAIRWMSPEVSHPLFIQVHNELTLLIADGEQTAKDSEWRHLCVWPDLSCGQCCVANA